MRGATGAAFLRLFGHCAGILSDLICHASRGEGKNAAAPLHAEENSGAGGWILDLDCQGQPLDRDRYIRVIAPELPVHDRRCAIIEACKCLSLSYLKSGHESAESTGSIGWQGKPFARLALRNAPLGSAFVVVFAGYGRLVIRHGTCALESVDHTGLRGACGSMRRVDRHETLLAWPEPLVGLWPSPILGTAVSS
jgi:hypothetical protein